VAEDSHVPPLPRRAPDDKRHVPGGKPGLGIGLTQPLALPESLRQRIRAALDYADDEAPTLEHDAVQEVEAPLEAGVPAGPQTAAPAEAAVWPAPAIAVSAEPALVPAQRNPAEQRPDRHDGRDGEGNGAGPPSPSATPTTRVGMWAYLGQTEAPTEPLPAIPAARPDGVTEKTREQPDAAAQPGPATVPASEPPAVPAQRAPAEQRPGQPDHLDARTAGPEQAPAPPPEPARPPERPGRGRGFKAGVALALVLALAGSLTFLLKRPAGTAHAIAPTTGPSTSAALGTAAEVRGATAAWVASQVSRAKAISCDPVMCQALRADGVPAADLLVLRPSGGDPLHSSVIVVTPAVAKMVGTKFLTADAPAAIASFGSGSRQDSVRVIYPQGAAAYAAALRQDIADRKANESALLENPRVTAPAAARRQLQDGQVDSRLLFTLGQLASQWPLSIVAFGDRAPGASRGVPLRSADLAVPGDAVGQARQMSAYARQLQDFFASARIRAVRLANGQAVVQVEFAAPSPFGVLNR
jgi:hypothetical protein